MKTKIFATTVVLVLVFLIGGCGPYFKNQAQYDKGEWVGLANRNEVTKIKQNRLAFKKLEAAPVQTEVKDGVTQGYKGLIVNLSSNNRYNFTLTGPETKSYLLGPGERANDYLIPGNYTCVVSQGNYKIGSWLFIVGPQQSTFMNEKYHWYVYADR